MSVKRKRLWGKLPGDIVDNIIVLHKTGKTRKEISKILDIPYSTVLSLLKRRGIDANIKHRNYTLNEDYFENIDSIDKAYFLGLLYADGNVSKVGGCGYRVKIGLQERDSYILERFANYCNFNGPILFRKKATDNHQNQKLLQIYSKKFYENACKQGLHDSKTFTLTFPKLDDIYMSHFIRGYFDGDGCVFIKQYKNQMSTSIQFLGTLDMCKGIKEYLTSILELRSDTKIQSKKSIFKYTINDRKDLLKVINYLYLNKKDCFLDRKLDKSKDVESYITQYYTNHPNRY
jgi:hypothetical protein